MKKYTSFVIVIIFIGLIFWLYTVAPEKNVAPSNDNVAIEEVRDYKNTSYIIEGEKITLENGLSEIEIAPNSASKKITRYWGGDFFKDLNADGREDVVFIVTQESGGSGLFYYVVAAINYPEGYQGGESFFLGDRIAPKNIELGDENTILVNFAERNPGESFDVEPSSARSIWLYFDPVSMQFGEIAPDFDL